MGMVLQKVFKNHRWVVGAVFLIFVAALPILTYPLGRDQAMYANIGRTILAGGTPYQDMWDIKPPPIYYLYAAGIAIFGTSTSAIRAIDLAVFPLGAIGLYLIGLHLRNRRVGVWAALLYGVFYFTETFASLTQSDSLVGIPMIWAVLATLKAGEHTGRRAAGWAFFAGGLCGLVIWFKQYFLTFVLALIIFHLLRRILTTCIHSDIPLAPPMHGGMSKTPRFVRGAGGGLWRVPGRVLQALLSDILAFCFGGLLTGGSLLAYFWSQGMIEEMLIIAEGTAAYSALGYDPAEFWAAMQNYLYFRWRHWGALFITIAIGTILGVVRWFSLPVHQPISHQPSAKTGLFRVGQHLLLSTFYALFHALKAKSQQLFPNSVRSNQYFLIYLWLFSGLAFMLMQAKGFDTHWLPMLPPLVLIAAVGLENSVQWLHAISQQQWAKNGYFLVGLYSIITLIFVFILLSNTWLRALPYLTGAETQVEYYAHFPEGGDLNPVHSVQVVEYLRPKIAIGDSIYIWGFRPEVAYMGGWRPATRFQAQFPLVVPWFPAAWQQENVETLWAAMPPVVLVVQWDYMPWVTGTNEDSHQLLVRYTELSNWLAANYERDTTIGSFIVWKKKPS